MGEADPPLALDLIHVSKRFGKQWVLKDLNLSVRRGKVLVLRGGNGTGKTTLLQLLSTRLRPSRGQARVMGLDVQREAAKVRQQIAYISVMGGSYSTLTAYENLELAAKLYGHARVDVRYYLERVGLTNVSNKLARNFSSGMKKRLAVARLLLSQAPLWLLDEPYAALDEEGKEVIDEALREAKQAAKTIIMASHDHARSQSFADSILLLEQGSLRRL